jgi:hypothetical protein
MSKYMLTLLVLSSILFVSLALSRSLVVVNSTGETADWIDLDSNSIDLQVATLGLVPNDFLVSGATGVAINSSSNDLYFYDLPEMTSSGQVWLGNNRSPWSGAWLGDDTLLVTNWLTSTISVIDVPGRSVVEEFQIGDPAQNINHPQGIVVVGDKAYVAMSCFNDEFVFFPGKIEIVDLEGDSTLGRIDIGLNPQSITRGFDGYLYAVTTGNYVDVFGKLYRIDPATDTVLDSLEVGGQPATIAITQQEVAFLAAGGWGFRRSTFGDLGLIYTVDLASWSVLHGPADPISSNNGVINVKTLSDTSIAVCCYQDDRINVIDSAGNVLATYSTGDGPTAVGKYPACFVPRGDVDGSGAANISDAVSLINFIFAGGVAPVSLVAGDANGDGTANISDAVYLIQYIFAGGLAPQGCAD